MCGRSARNKNGDVVQIESFTPKNCSDLRGCFSARLDVAGKHERHGWQPVPFTKSVCG